MSDGQSNKPKGLRRPVEVVRAELMADAQTKEIAETLGVSLEDYVAQVLEYAQNPDKEPELYVASDAEMRAAGEEVHTTEDVAAWMEKVASGEINVGPMQFKDGFSSDNRGAKGAVDLGGGGGGSALRDQVARQQKKDESA